MTVVAQRVLGGRYRLQEVLGRGGTATVWRGHDLRLQRGVAVKVLDAAVVAEPGVCERLAREARTLARLAHPNIVVVHDFDVEDDTAYLVMELVEGPSLAVLLARGRLSVARAVAIAVGVCDALTAAHGAGLVHRDIKPGNLLVPSDGVVKVCDFGIAVLPTAATVTDTATVVGTSEYLAPERASGQAGDARSDLYALGCVMYAMLAGTAPFTGVNPVSVLYQHLRQPPRPLADVREDIPAGLDGLVLDLLAKNPADRPDSAAAVRDRLTALAGHPGTAADTAAGTVAAGVAAPATTTVPTLPGEAADPALTWMMTRPGGHRRRSRWPTPEGPSLRWAVAAFVILVLLGGAFAVLSPLGGSPSGVGPAGGSSPSAVSDSDSPQPEPTETSPPTTSAPTPSTSAARPATPADQIIALQSTVTGQANTGQLDSRAAGELRDSLDDIARRLSKGQTGQVASRVAQLRDRLTGLAQDGKLTSRGYQVLAAGIDQLADSLAP